MTNSINFPKIATYIGTNDEKDHCEKCGKTGLKRVMWFFDDITGKDWALGTTCGARLMGISEKTNAKNESSIFSTLQDLTGKQIEMKGVIFNVLKVKGNEIKILKDGLEPITIRKNFYGHTIKLINSYFITLKKSTNFKVVN